MRLIRNSSLALLVLACAVVFAASGIEVLSATQTQDGIEVLSHSTEAPPGSSVHAIMNVNGPDIIVGISPVDPFTGNTTSFFPFNHPNNRLDLRGPTGDLLSSVGGIVGGYDFD